MTTYTASVTNTRTGQSWQRVEFDSAELAAAHLFLLLTSDGWGAERDDTITALAAGQPIRHKRFEYSVREAGDA